MNTAPSMAPLEDTPVTVADIFPAIEERWLEWKRSKIKQYPQNNLRASSVGWPCDRFHYHSLTDWRERTLPDATLQSIFDEGTDHERLVMRDLAAMGFEVVEQQRSFQIDTPLITGHVDGILRWQGRDFPFDVKSISPYEWERISTIDDLLQSRKVYQRLYPAQLQLYLLMTNNEFGFLLLKNKLTGRPKIIRCQIDYGYIEQLLQRAERVYGAAQQQTPPERTDDFEVCRTCPFRHVCLPDLTMGPGVQHIDDIEMAALLTRRAQLEPVAKEFEQLDKQVKDVAKADGPGEKVCGNFLLRVKAYQQKRKVPITWEEKVETYMKTQIVSLNGATEPVRGAEDL